MRRTILSALLGAAALAASPCLLPAAGTAVRAADPVVPASEPGAALAPARYLAMKLEADAAWSARDVEGAVALYQRLLAADPRDGDSRFRLALGLYRLGRADEAREHLLRCHEEGFDNPARTAVAMAEAAAKAGDRDAAYAWLETALAAPLENRPDLQTNEAFAAMRDDPRFRELAGFLPAGEMSREEGWRHDLGFFLAEARRMHAHPDRRAFGPELAAAVEALEVRVGDLDDVGVAMELQKIVVAHLADGHSVVYPMPTERVDFGGLLPVRFYRFDDGLFVVAAQPEHADLVGARVLALDGHASDDVLRAIAAVVPRDNEQGLLRIGPFYMTSPAALRSVGMAASQDRVTLSVEDARGRRDVALEAGPHFEFDTRVPPAPGQAPPRWLARQDEAIWWEPRPELNAAYVQFNMVRNPEGGPTIAAMADSVRAGIAARGLETLIVDVRHNSGGNGFLVWPLVRLAAWHEMSAAGNRTFVITGRNTFSACQNFVNHLERMTSAVFVGEPAGSRPNFPGEDTHVVLPWSGIRLSISSRWWQDGEPGDLRPYVPVSMPVGYTSEDWRAGRDPVMEALGEYLNGAR